MVTSTRLALRAVCWGIAILIGLPALVLQLVAWGGGIQLPENVVIWAVSVSMTLGYIGQKVGQPKPQILTVRSDKELNSLKEGLAAVRAEVHNIMEVLRAGAGGSGGGRVVPMPNPRIYQLGIEEGIRRAKGGDDQL